MFFVTYNSDLEGVQQIIMSRYILSTIKFIRLFCWNKKEGENYVTLQDSASSKQKISKKTFKIFQKNKISQENLSTNLELPSLNRASRYNPDEIKILKKSNLQ